MLEDVVIYSTEPPAVRALTAEIRHAPTAFTRLLRRSLGCGLGTLTSIECEVPCGTRRRLDLRLTFGQRQPHRVGIEAKFDHTVTSGQLEAERSVVDSLVLLVPNEGDGDGYDVDAAITWAQALDCFSDSRLTKTDIRQVSDTKRQVERLLDVQADRLAAALGRGWDVTVHRGGSGMPSIVLESPDLPNGRKVCGQIQVPGRGRTPPLDTVRFEYAIGISVPNDLDNYPVAEDVDRAPERVKYVDTLDTQVLRGQLTELRVSKHAGGNGSEWPGSNKKGLVDKFLPGRSWLAKGYTDGSSLGIKSRKAGVDDLADLCDTASWLFKRWYKACLTLDKATGPT